MRTEEEVEKTLRELREANEKHPNDTLRDGAINALEWVLKETDFLYGT